MRRARRFQDFPTRDQRIPLDRCKQAAWGMHYSERSRIFWESQNRWNRRVQFASQEHHRVGQHDSKCFYFRGKQLVLHSLHRCLIRTSIQTRELDQNKIFSRLSEGQTRWLWSPESFPASQFCLELPTLAQTTQDQSQLDWLARWAWHFQYRLYLKDGEDHDEGSLPQTWVYLGDHERKDNESCSHIEPTVDPLRRLKRAKFSSRRRKVSLRGQAQQDETQDQPTWTICCEFTSARNLLHIGLQHEVISWIDGKASEGSFQSPRRSDRQPTK